MKTTSKAIKERARCKSICERNDKIIRDERVEYILVVAS